MIRLLSTLWAEGILQFVVYAISIFVMRFGRPSTQHVFGRVLWPVFRPFSSLTLVALQITQHMLSLLFQTIHHVHFRRLRRLGKRGYQREAKGELLELITTHSCRSSRRLLDH